jgi:hypothetical protein
LDDEKNNQHAAEGTQQVWQCMLKHFVIIIMFVVVVKFIFF